MLEYIRPQNIDDRILKKAGDILSSGGLVAFPTDTSWSIGCDVKSKTGIEKLKKLKGIAHFTPTVMTENVSQWTQFVDLGNSAFRFIKPYVPGPFVFIFPALDSMEKHFGMKRLEVGLRIPKSSIPLALVKILGRPLFAITASKQLAEPGWWDESYAQEYLFESGYELEDIRMLDLVLDSSEELPKYLSTVVDMTSGSPQVIRQGLGRL